MQQTSIEDFIINATAEEWSHISKIVKESGRNILTDWQKQRFVICNQEGQGYPGIIIVLCDITFWNVNFDALFDWCKTYDAKLAGMTVELTTQEQLSLFCLRWS